MDEENLGSLKEKLEQLSWPSVYMYKFIVPTENEHEILKILSNEGTSSRPSKNGKYTSITSTVMTLSPEAVIDVYREASKVQGVIAL